MRSLIPWVSASCLVLITLLALSLTFPVLAEEALIDVGDVLRIDLPGEETLNKDFQVDRRGRIRLPEIGSVEVAGVTMSEAKQRVGDALGQVFRDLSRLSVTFEEPRLLMRVLGYVNQPGMVDLREDSTVQAAIEAAGGLRSGAQLDRLQIRRGADSITFDYKRYLDTGDLTLLPELHSLDTLFVPTSPLVGNIEVDFSMKDSAQSGDAADQKSGINVFGEVRSPGSFSFRAGLNVVDLIMRAGGVTRFAAVEQIRLISGDQPTKFNLKRYLDTGDQSGLDEVPAGSTIFVPRQEEEIKSGPGMVYIMGQVNSPGAFEFKTGATFMDIFANAGGPTRFAETRLIHILHPNGSVDPYDLFAYTEGLPGAELPPQINPGDAILVPEKTDMNEKSWLKVAPDRAVRIMGQVQRAGRFEWGSEMNLLDLIAHAGGPTKGADVAKIRVIRPTASGRDEVEVFDLDAFLRHGGRVDELPRVIAGTTVMFPELPDDPDDNKAQWLRLAPEDSIYVFGEVSAPGRYAFNEHLDFIDLLGAVDGPTADADLRNVRINHRGEGRSRVTRVNLARYFETGDDSILPRIKNGDTLYFPKVAGGGSLDVKREETVRVLGAVGKPGRYRFDENMTILDLLAEAGGTGASAWLDRIAIVNMSCCKDQARVFDLEQFMRKPDARLLPLVKVGDTVFVPDKSVSTMSEIRQGVTDVVSILTLYRLVTDLSQ